MIKYYLTISATNLTMHPITEKIKPLLPMWLRYRLMDMRKRGIYSNFADDCQCIFIHIPKAAGSSIALTLFNQPSRHVPYFEYQQANPSKFKQYFKFTFVRNPWDRLVSSYFFLKNGGMNEIDANWAKQNLSDFATFEDFVYHWVNKENIWSWVHFLPQHHFICDQDNKIMMDFVGKMENIETDFAYIASQLGCEKELKKVNVISRKHYSYYYNPKTLSIVANIYAKDIALFNYTFHPSN